MDFVKQVLSLVVAVFIVMVVIYVLRKAGGGLPVVGEVVRTVWN